MYDQTAKVPTADEYERSNIASAGEVIHRDKHVSRALAGIMVAMMVMCVGLGIGGFAQGAPLAATLGVGIVGIAFLFLGLVRSVVRTVVTADDVHVHWGLWGPRIPLRAITVVAVRNDCSRQALIAAIAEPGTAGPEMICIPTHARVVDLQWTDSDGKPRRIWLGAEDNVALSAAITRAAANAKARVRVASASQSNASPTGQSAATMNERSAANERRAL